MKKYFLIATCALLFFVVGCAAEEEPVPAPGAELELDPPGDEAPAPEPEPVQTELPDVIEGRIIMEDGGVISFELFPEIAPQSVYNFVYLARQGFYDGLVFHRIMSGFMIQGGCPMGIGAGNPGYSIVGEFADNGFENDISHVRGVLSMARSPDYNSAGSQFFIVHGDSLFLDGAYAGFGRVTDGMDVVDRIAETPNNGPNGSVADEDMPAMSTIIIDFDGEVPEPDKLPR